MADPLQIDKPGLFGSVLHWLGRPGYAVRDVLQGNLSGALRQGIQGGLDLVDAALPGDWLGDITREGDSPEASDLVGGMEPGLGKTAVDILGGIATDPLTYLTFGAAPAIGAASKIAGGAAKASKAAGGVKLGIPFTNIGTKTYAEGKALDPLSLLDQGYLKGKAKLPQTMQDVLSDTGVKVRAAVGAQRVTPWLASLAHKGRTQEELTQKAGLGDLDKQFAGYSDEARKAAYWAINNTVKDPLTGKAREILPDEGLDAAAYTTGKTTEDLKPFAGDSAPITPEGNLYPHKVRTSDVERLNPMPGIEDLSEEAQQELRYLQKQIPDEIPTEPGAQQAALGIGSMRPGVKWNEDTTVEALNDARVRIHQKIAYLQEAKKPVPDHFFEADNYLKSYGQWLSKNAPDRGPFTFKPSPILDQAYPAVETENKFASGIDLVNKVHGSGPDPLKLLKEGATTSPEPGPAGMGVDEALKSVKQAEGGELPTAIKPQGTALEQMLGRAGETPTRPNIELPTSVTDALVEQLGGAKAGIEKLAASTAPDSTEKFDYVENIINRWNKRVDAMPGLSADQRVETKAMLAKILPHTQAQFRELVEKGAYFAPKGTDLMREAPVDYIRRSYTGFMPEMEAGRFGNSDALKQRVLPTGKKYADWLNENPDLVPEEDAVKALVGRVGQQGSIKKRLEIGRPLIEEQASNARKKLFEGQGEAKLTPAEQKSLEASGKAMSEGGFGPAVDEIIKEIHAKGDKESAKFLYDSYHGLPPRGTAMAAIDKLSVPFKKAAVMGVLIPRWTANVRNRITGIPQVASTEGAGAALGRMASPKQIGRDLLGAIDDAAKDTFGWRIPGSDLTDSLEATEKAFRDSGGLADVAIQNLRKTHPEVADAMEHGVMDGFVNSEELIKESTRKGWKKTFSKFMDAPAKIFRGVENRMRLGTYLDLVKKGGKSPEEAARLTDEAFFDYRITSPENRNLRTLLPFAQFMVKAMPQQAKWLSRNPALDVGLDQLYGQKRGQPIYPWLAQQSSVPLGDDKDGNLQVASGFGMPWEVLNAIPNPSASPQDFGRDIERGIVSSGQPGLKSLYSLVSGHDPYFRSDTGSYDKVPLIGDVGHGAGSAYNMLAGTGVIQPVDTSLRLLDRLTNTKQSLPAWLAENTIGANVVSVDQDRALQQLLQQALEANPTVHKSTSLYQMDKDPQTQELLKELRDQRSKIKKKRKAEAEK